MLFWQDCVSLSLLCNRGYRDILYRNMVTKMNKMYTIIICHICQKHFNQSLISNKNTLLGAADAWGYLPRPICTNPVMMMRARANILAYVKTSWTRVAHFTLAQFTKVNTTATYTKQWLEIICKSISKLKIFNYCNFSQL